MTPKYMSEEEWMEKKRRDRMDFALREPRRVLQDFILNVKAGVDSARDDSIGQSEGGDSQPH